MCIRDRTYTAWSDSGPLPALAFTEDFRNFDRVGAILPPENKDAAVFPVRIDGKWAVLHRPVSRMICLLYTSDTREGCFTAWSWIDRRGYCRGNTHGFERNLGLTAFQIQTRWKEQWPGNLKSHKCCYGDGTRLM